MSWDAGSCVEHADLYRSFRCVVSRKRGAQGKPHFVWEPVMPRIKPEHERCVFFLYQGDDSTPIGTGFFVSRDVHLYAVTNHHVAVREGATQIRVNTKQGSRRIDTSLEFWESSAASDLAACDVTGLLQESDEIVAIEEREFVTEDFVRAADLGLGDEVFMLGLLAGRGGADRNELSVRFGSIGQMASDNAPISMTGYKPKAAFLTDLRSRGGYSGSPVITFRTTFYDLRNFGKGTYGVSLGDLADSDKNSSFMRLLGVHCGGKTERLELSGGGKPAVIVEVESATGVVVPAWEISRLLDTEKLERLRQEREAARDPEEFVTHDLASGESDR